MSKGDIEKLIKGIDGCFAKNDYEGARGLLLNALSSARERDDRGMQLFASNELMGLCRKLGEGEAAIGYAEGALSLVLSMGIENNVGAATTYINSATVYKAFERPEDSIVLFERARVIYERELSKSDDRLGALYNNMALTLVDLLRYSEADALYKRALDVMRGISGREPEQAMTYLNMATAAEAELGLEDGEERISECVRAAQALLDVGKDRTDGNYAFVCEKCASVFGYYGYFDYEQRLKERSRRIYEGA